MVFACVGWMFVMRMDWSICERKCYFLSWLAEFLTMFCLFALLSQILD
ncbi:hypothetical protein HMPREF0424_0767 [Gardnerella vaginalis 409-05]|nr:hypothetical protein HMPREF0424_0767 [Gardnerella vaginalis 409-05]